MGLPRISASDRDRTKAAGFHSPGVHYGSDWYAKGTQQYDYLKKHFGSDRRWPRLPKGLHAVARKKRKGKKGKR